MRRISVLFLAAVLLLGLVGCGDGSSDPREEAFSFTYSGIKIRLNAEATPIVNALGEPESYTEEPSCAFEGVDKTYCYGSFYLSTYPTSGRDYVYRLWFTDDEAATEEGIRIGSTKSQVEAAYGENGFDGVNRYVLTKGQTRLILLLEEEKVSSIRYEVSLD